MEEKKLTAKERRERNFYDAQYMIYYELPVLIKKAQMQQTLQLRTNLLHSDKARSSKDCIK